MYRRWWLWAVVLGLTSVIGAAQDELARAKRINQQAIGIDTHIDTLQRILIEKVDIDHAVKVAGTDHVGIGTDYDGVSSVPAGPVFSCSRFSASCQRGVQGCESPSKISRHNDFSSVGSPDFVRGGRKKLPGRELALLPRPRCERHSGRVPTSIRVGVWKLTNRLPGYGADSVRCFKWIVCRGVEHQRWQ